MSHETKSNLDFNESNIIEITQNDMDTLANQKQNIWKKHIFNINHYFQPKDGLNSKKLRMTNISIYSTTPWKEGKIISGIIDKQLRSLLGDSYNRKNTIITDATANIGGNTISFYLKGFGKVNAVEIDKLTCDILKNNLDVYGLGNKGDVHCANYLDLYTKLRQDVVFIDPPWGGPKYKEAKLLDLYLGNTNIIDICKTLMEKKLTKIIALKVPVNYNLPTLINAMPNSTFLTVKIYRYGKKFHSYSIVLCF
jgi:16S rRNA G966 N2-methylase RsmD